MIFSPSSILWISKDRAKLTVASCRKILLWENITMQHSNSMAGSGRSGACRQSDQTWQGVWLHNRDILSASCIVHRWHCCDFSEIYWFWFIRAWKPDTAGQKRGWSYRCPFFFFMNWYFYLCFCVICGNINTDSKKKLSAVCIGLATSHICWYLARKWYHISWTCKAYKCTFI